MIAIVRDGHAVILSLERVGSRNAFGLADWRALAEVCGEISRSGCRSVILRSAVPRTFCSGSDLDEIAALAGDVGGSARFRTAMSDGIEGLANLPMPVVAAIDGACFGAGVALALACDVRIAAPASHFGVPPARLGISYPRQDVRRLVDAVGRGHASRLLFTANPISADEAFSLRLIDILSPRPEDDAREMAGHISANDSSSIALLKRSIARVDTQDDAQFDRAFDEMFASEEFRRRASATRAKARPVR